MRESTAMFQQTEGADSPDYLMAMHDLGGALIDSGDLLAAEKSERGVLGLRRKVDPRIPISAIR